MPPIEYDPMCDADGEPIDPGDIVAVDTADPDGRPDIGILMVYEGDGCWALMSGASPSIRFFSSHVSEFVRFETWLAEHGSEADAY